MQQPAALPSGLGRTRKEGGEGRLAEGNSDRPVTDSHRRSQQSQRDEPSRPETEGATGGVRGSQRMWSGQASSTFGQVRPYLPKPP